MVTYGWMYDAIIYLYALSLLVTVSELNRKWKRAGTGLLVFVWLLQTVYVIVVLNGLDSGFLSMFETLLLFSWLLVTLSLIIDRFIRAPLFVFFANLFGFTVLALNFFSRDDAVPTVGGWDISDELLFVHISLALLSYAAFAVSAVFSGMYLLLHEQLKKRRWSNLMLKMPSLDKIERFAYRSAAVGIPLFIMALSLGFDWILLSGNYSLLLDPKVIASVLVLLVYAVYLTLRLLLAELGHRLAAWNLAAFVIVIVNLLLSNFVSRFHKWI